MQELLIEGNTCLCLENSNMVGATCRSPADGIRKSETGERPLAPTVFIFMRQRARHQAREGLPRKCRGPLPTADLSTGIWQLAAVRQFRYNRTGGILIHDDSRSFDDHGGTVCPRLNFLRSSQILFTIFGSLCCETISGTKSTFRKGLDPASRAPSSTSFCNSGSKNSNRRSSSNFRIPGKGAAFDS
jgi:hypothetical protein